MKSVKDLKNYTFKENAFTFANEGIKMSDQKFDTKPTSFVKDSFRRFCKNKSSVVAAIILGILILFALLVPLFSPHETIMSSVAEEFLQPKLFEAGTGFWDGTKKYEKKINLDGSSSGVMYDRVNETPAGFYRPAVMNLVVDEEPTLVNQASPYGTGGYVMFENQLSGTSNTATMNSQSFTVTADGNYSVTIAFSSEDDVLGSKLGEYRVYFSGSDGTQIVLRDWGKDYSDLTVNLSTVVANAGLDELAGSIYFELKPLESSSSYILIKSCVIAADQADGQDLENLGFSDATAMVLKAKDSTGTFPYGYWSCTGRKGIYASEVYFCSFVYDTYAAVYDQKEVVYANSDFQKLLDQGLCSYDPAVGPESFVKLSDDCPIESVVSQKLNSKTGKLLEITVKCYRYKIMGYDSMPKFIFGTDQNGNDVLTKMFEGLRTSLMLGVFTFAFCFMFGLVWGSISGYFGGVVDLAMERFCDILGGVPWIVVMTLCILHLGNNFTTFFLALCMTGWMGTAARTRTQFYRFKHMEYVLASRTLGSKDLRLIFKHILPNSLGTIVTSSVLMIPSVIFSESTLAYLNLGLQGVSSFGVMLSSNQQYIKSNSYLIVVPSVVMALLMISFNLFGNGLRDAINPTLKGSN